VSVCLRVRLSLSPFGNYDPETSKIRLRLHFKRSSEIFAWKIYLENLYFRPLIKLKTIESKTDSYRNVI